MTKNELIAAIAKLESTIAKKDAYIEKLQHKLGHIQIHLDDGEVRTTFNGEVGKAFCQVDSSLELLPNDHPSTQFLEATYAVLEPAQQEIVDKEQGYTTQGGRYKRRKAIRTKVLTK